MGREFINVTGEENIPEGAAKIFEVGGHRIVLCRAQGEVYAIQDLCTHDDGPLGEGWLDGCEIECPRHGARFDVRTGEVRRMPAAFPIKTFPVKLEKGRVWVALED